MEIKPEDLFESLEVFADTLWPHHKPAVFSLNNVPKRGEYEYPIVDRTLGIGILVRDGHKFLTHRLGSLHTKKEVSLYSERDDDIEFFLKNHGYYWSGVNRSGILVTTRNFKYDSQDKILASKWRLSLLDKDYPFD